MPQPSSSVPDSLVSVRLVFADRGSFHEMVVDLPESLLERHERLIDALREEPEITGGIYVDTRRLVAAYREPRSE